MNIKKISIGVICVLIIIAGGFYLFKKINEEQVPRCEEGYRFVPSTQTCEPITEEESELDFAQILIQIPDSSETVQLQKDAQEGAYSAQYSVSTVSGAQGFVSLNQKEVLYYSENLILVPFMVNSGGTGNFMYIGLFDISINKHLSSVFVGDRIGVDTLETKNNTVHALFKKRLDTEGFAAQPTIPTELVLQIMDDRLVEMLRIENARYEDVELRGLPIFSKNQMLDIRGAIPGNWYFEAIAQYQIFDNEYNQIAIGPVQAMSDWMTIQRVPFEIKVSTSNIGYKGKATLIIESHNIRGDEEGERAIKRISIPITID